ncbi:MAG: hypothetical protein AB1297_01365 [bacterium]
MLYGITEHNRNFIYSFDGKEKKKVFETEKLITNFVGSLDGKKIAFVSKNKIWIIGIENRKKKIFSLSCSNPLSLPYSLSFSPKGEKIAFLFGEKSPFKTNLWIIDCKDWSLKQLTSKNNIFFNDNPLPLSWSPNGNKILVLQDLRDKTVIELVNLKGDSKEYIFEGIEIDLFRPIFSKNGEEIVFIGKTKENLASNIYILNLETQKLEQITKFKDINVCGEMSFSYDGRKIAFVVFDKGYNIWVINKDETGLKKLTNNLDNSNYHYPIWLKDDKLACLKIKTLKE